MDDLGEAFQTLREAADARHTSSEDWQPKAITAGLFILESFFRDVHIIAENTKFERQHMEGLAAQLQRDYLDPTEQ